MAEMVYVWLDPDLTVQHLTTDPTDDTAREWEGVTACGLEGVLRWIPRETTDRGASCPACAEVAGNAPPLGGQPMGPP